MTLQLNIQLQFPKLVIRNIYSVNICLSASWNWQQRIFFVACWMSRVWGAEHHWYAGSQAEGNTKMLRYLHDDVNTSYYWFSSVTLLPYSDQLPPEAGAGEGQHGGSSKTAFLLQLETNVKGRLAKISQSQRMENAPTSASMKKVLSTRRGP